jgi:hypothetical protein
LRLQATKCDKGIAGIPANPNCSTLAGNGGPGITGAFATRTEAMDSLRGCPQTMAYAIRNGRYRYIANVPYDLDTYKPLSWTKPVSQQLYDYDLDPHETQNLAGNVTFEPLMKELNAQLEEMLGEGGR